MSVDCPKLDDLAFDIGDGIEKGEDAVPEISSDDFEDEAEIDDAIEGALAREQRKYARLSGKAQTNLRPIRKAASTVKNYLPPEDSDDEEKEQE